VARSGVRWTARQLREHRAGHPVAVHVRDERAWNARYRSKLEERFMREGPGFLMMHYGVPVVALYFEPASLRIPSGRCTVDFLADFQGDRSLWIELKGSRDSRGYEASRARLRSAAACYPTQRFCQVLPAGKSWELEEIR
jgi:hypothetical protein